MANKNCTKCGEQMSGNQFKKHGGLCEACRTPESVATEAPVEEKTEDVVAEAEAVAEAAEAEAPAEEVVEATAEAEAEAPATPEPEVLSDEDKAIVDAITAMPDGEAKEKALARFGKLKAQDDKSSQAKRFAEFDTEVKSALPEFLTELAKKHNVSLLGRKITVAFPTDGSEAKHQHTPIGSRSSSGNGGGGGKGFTTHGEVEFEGSTHKSLHALADVLGLQYEGRRTAFQVFEEPLSKGDKQELPYKYTVTRQESGKLLVTKVDK